MKQALVTALLQSMKHNLPARLIQACFVIALHNLEARLSEASLDHHHNLVVRWIQGCFTMKQICNNLVTW